MAGNNGQQRHPSDNPQLPFCLFFDTFFPFPDRDMGLSQPAAAITEPTKEDLHETTTKTATNNNNDSSCDACKVFAAQWRLDASDICGVRASGPRAQPNTAPSRSC